MFSKKLTAFILCLVFLIPQITFTVNAGWTGISIGDHMAQRGDVISIPIVLNYNPGLTMLNLTFEYDESRLYIHTPPTRGNALGAINFSQPPNFSPPFTFNWFSTSPQWETGTLITIDFTVLDNAPYGEGFISIRISGANQHGVNFTNPDARGMIYVAGDTATPTTPAQTEAPTPSPPTPEATPPAPTEPPEPDREAEQRAPEDAPDWLFRVIANQPAFTAPAQTPPIAGAPPVRVFMATPHTPPVNIMPEALVAVRINEDGSRQRVISGLFNPAQNEMRWHGFEGAYYIIESNMVDFVDVSPGEWFHGAVTFAAARELFEGMGGGRFEPYTHMTRAMFITVLSRLDGIDAEFYHGAATFADVGDGDNAWYNAAISWGQFRGIITPGILAGGAPNHFRPHDNITREEMAVMIANYLSYRDLPLGATLVPQFYDITNAAPWAQIPIATMRSHGIIAGRGDNTFDPASTATRAEVSQIFRNLVHAITGLN